MSRDARRRFEIKRSIHTHKLTDFGSMTKMPNKTNSKRKLFAIWLYFGCLKILCKMSFENVEFIFQFVHRCRLRPSQCISRQFYYFWAYQFMFEFDGIKCRHKMNTHKIGWIFPFVYNSYLLDRERESCWFFSNAITTLNTNPQFIWMHRWQWWSV